MCKHSYGFKIAVRNIRGVAKLCLIEEVQGTEIIIAYCEGENFQRLQSLHIPVSLMPRRDLPSDSIPSCILESPLYN